MYRIGLNVQIGLNVRNRPQCTESASMYGIGLNVQLSDWLRQIT